MSERKTMSFEFTGMVLTVEDTDGNVHTFDFGDLPGELDGKFMELGRKTKLANFAASAKAEGRDRIEMMQAGWTQLLSGVWEKEREGGGPTVSPEVEALAKIKGASVSAIQKKLREYDKDTRAKILGNAKVKAEAEKIREAREKTVSLDDLS